MELILFQNKFALALELCYLILDYLANNKKAIFCLFTYFYDVRAMINKDPKRFMKFCEGPDIVYHKKIITNPPSINMYSITRLVRAAENGYKLVVRDLLAKNKQYQGKRIELPIYTAIRNAQKDVLRLLLKACPYKVDVDKIQGYFQRNAQVEELLEEHNNQYGTWL